MLSKKRKAKNLSTCVIIATRNRLPDLLTFLDSLACQTEVPDELIIVDSSEKKLTDHKKFLEVFAEKNFCNTKLVYTHTTKPGAARQRNIGARMSSEDLFYFFDDDTVLRPNYLEVMNSILRQRHDYAGGMATLEGVQPKRKSIDRFIKSIFCLQKDNAAGMFTMSGMPTHPYGLKKFMEVQVLGGCCVYRSSVFKKYWFDEKLGRYSYMEDCDLSFRVSRKHKLFFNPATQLEHRHSPRARDTTEEISVVLMRNYSYLFFKNFYSRRRLKIIFYFWTVYGLFFQALFTKNKAALKGYWRGLKKYYSEG